MSYDGPTQLPLTPETAEKMTRSDESAWNSLDTEFVTRLCSSGVIWSECGFLLRGPEEVETYLRNKWEKQLDFRLAKELWTFSENGIVSRLTCEFRNANGQWFRETGIEILELDEVGLITFRQVNLNETPILESERMIGSTDDSSSSSGRPGLVEVVGKDWRGNPEYVSDIAFTPTVKALQERHGSRQLYQKMEQQPWWQTRITSDIRDLVSELDMFYLGTANHSGQPYIQYRGGPKGFLHALDEKTLGFADFKGNTQFITTGNITENPRAFIFLIDYKNRRRVKIWGTARVVEDDQDLLERVSHVEYLGKPERVVLFEVEAWDSNCSKHLHARLRASEVLPKIDQLKTRIAELEKNLES